MTPKITTCVFCQAPFEMGVNVFTEAGVREVKLSGVCEKCFDATFPEVDDDGRAIHSTTKDGDE